MTTRTTSIGIFGGSFNPIHYGHIELAKQLLVQQQLDEVWFVVSPLNPFKQQADDLLSDKQRWLLTETALATEPRLRACDVEFHLPRPSYMWNTLQHLSQHYPTYRFTLLIGADNWLSFHKWAHWQSILDHYAIAIYPRDGYPLQSESLPPGVTLVTTTRYPVSSTLIRSLVKQGASIRGMVPAAIETMVESFYQ